MSALGRESRHRMDSRMQMCASTVLSVDVLKHGFLDSEGTPKSLGDLGDYI